MRQRLLSTIGFPGSVAPAPAAAHRINRRSLAWALLAISAVAIAAVLGTMAGTSTRARRAIGPAYHAQAHLSTAASLAISRGLGADLAGYRLARSSGGFLARNARQGLTASFAAHGATISTRGGAHASIALQAIGSGTALHPVGLARPLAHANRAEYQRGAATEWFANGPAGVEQGFTVAAKPAGATNGALTLALGLSGTLTARPGADGGLVLTGAGGKAVLRYGDLSVTDARGRALPAHMTVEHGRVLISVDARGARYPLTVDPLMSVAELYASDGEKEDELGTSVAISGNVVVAGEPLATIAGKVRQGAAYVFTEGAGGWATGTQTAKLLSSNGKAEDTFGGSVAISGKTIVIGAPGVSSGSGVDAGAAYVFTEPEGGWGTPATQDQTAELINSEDVADYSFGTSVGISGETIVVGTPLYRNYVYKGAAHSDRDGAAFVFQEPAGGWSKAANPQTQTTTLTLSEKEAIEAEELDHFGDSIAIDGTADEQTVVVGDSGAKADENYRQGAAFIFNRPAGGWKVEERHPGARLTASDGTHYEYLATAVAISSSGEDIVAGAPEDEVNGKADQGAAYVFERPSGGWEAQSQQTQAATLIASAGAAGNFFGRSVTIEGPTVMVQGDGNGYVYSMPAGGWSGELHQSSELEGYAYSLALTPGYAIVGEIGRKPPKETGHTLQGDVEVIPLGPIVTTGSTGGLSTNSATIEGSVAPNRNAVSKCAFQYGTSTSYGTEVPCAQTVVGTGLSPTIVTAALTGLVPGTTYHYRVVASNGDGTSYGVDATFTTQSSKGGPPPEEKSTGGGSTTTGTTSTSTTSTPSTSTSAPVSVASSPKAVEELLNGCSSSALVLNDVYIQGAHVAIRGSAAKSLVGKKVKILFNEGKSVATATVEANGQYTTTAPLPPAKIRDNLNTRYTAEVGKLRSVHLKLVRRLLLEPPKASGTTVMLIGQLTLPLTKPIAPVVVEQQLECGKTTIAKTFTPSASGRFDITVTVPANAKAAIFRLTSKVAANKHSVTHGFTTFSLPLPVALG